jgi:hypothetical protein
MKTNIGGEQMAIIKDVINEYFNAWNKGYITKNSDEIRNYMSRNFVGYWAHSNIIEPEPYYYDYDLNSVLKQLDNASKSFNITSYTERKNGDDFSLRERN